MIVRVELYGRLREAGLGDEIKLQFARRPKACEVIEELKRRLGKNGEILKGSALASQTAVLQLSQRIPTGRLAVLPPVCGG